MDDCPVDAHRLEVIDSGSGERLYSAMRDQAERGREFQRRVRWMWLRRELSIPPVPASVIDLRDALPTQVSHPSDDSITLSAVPLSSTVVALEPRQEDSA
jgi:hypothetical protein